MPHRRYVTAAVLGLATLALVTLVRGAGTAGAFSEAQASRGKTLYAAKCASCHGAELEGGDHGPSMNDDNFWDEWDGKTARSFYARIISTMPMDDPGSLAEKDVIDIVAHIVASNGAATGSKSVERADELSTIKLERPQ